MPKPKKALVVDASVARSAGITDHPTSIHCRSFLTVFKEQGLLIVMSPEIRAEWEKHRSNFSYKWLAQMKARRRIVDVGNVKDDLLRERIDKTSDKEKGRRAMEKDCLLLEAALKSDHRVASLDETVRNLFHHAAKTVREIRSIVWVNPDKEEENVIAWLQNGVPADKKRQLGYVAVTP